MAVPQERGDYRIRRSWLLWVVERRWLDGWTQIGLPMRYASAHAVLHELNDWQWQATEETRSVMRGQLPSIWRPGRLDHQGRR